MFLCLDCPGFSGLWSTMFAPSPKYSPLRLAAKVRACNYSGLIAAREYSKVDSKVLRCEQICRLWTSRFECWVAREWTTCRRCIAFSAWTTLSACCPRSRTRCSRASWPSSTRVSSLPNARRFLFCKHSALPLRVVSVSRVTRTHLRVEWRELASCACTVQVSQMIKEKLIERAHDFYLVVDDVSITDLSFSKEYTAAVEAKQVAQQEAQRANSSSRGPNRSANRRLCRRRARRSLLSPSAARSSKTPATWNCDEFALRKTFLASYASWMHKLLFNTLQYTLLHLILYCTIQFYHLFSILWHLAARPLDQSRVPGCVHAYAQHRWCRSSDKTYSLRIILAAFWNFHRGHFSSHGNCFHYSKSSSKFQT